MGRTLLIALAFAAIWSDASGFKEIIRKIRDIDRDRCSRSRDRMEMEINDVRLETRERLTDDEDVSRKAGEKRATDRVGEVPRLAKLPKKMKGMRPFMMKGGKVGKGSRLKLRCCGSKICEFIISIFDCAPCSRGYNGGFPNLKVDGWRGRGCGPIMDYEGKDALRTATIRRLVKPDMECELTESETDAIAVCGFGRERDDDKDDDWCEGEEPRFTGPNTPRRLEPREPARRRRCWCPDFSLWDLFKSIKGPE